MAVITRFQDRTYVNWLKAGQALLCTAEGICDFCKGPIEQFHQDLVKTFPKNLCTCGSNKTLCTVCGNRNKEIKDQFKPPNSNSTEPCWGNADMGKWEKNAWETAKVFMTRGQETRTGPSDTDPCGLLQLVLNCELFKNCVFKMQSFEKVNEIRNKLFHSADFKLSDVELEDYIKDMTTLLQDPKQLKADPNAMRAVIQLNQIKSLSLEIDEAQVLEAERTVWKTTIEEMSKEQSVTREKVKKALDFISKYKCLNKALKDDIEPLKKRMKTLEIELDEIEEQCTGLDDQVTKLEAGKKELQEQRMEQHKRRKVILKEREQLYARSHKVVDTLKPHKRVKVELQTWKEQLRDAHKDKIEKYLKNTNTRSIEQIKQFNDIYVEPIIHESGEDKRLLTRLDINTLTCHMDIGQCKQVRVEELFAPGVLKERTKKVLITGAAGSGKSMLSMYLLNMWLEGKLFDFEDVFFYSMKELTHVATCSLVQLLFKFQCNCSFVSRDGHQCNYIDMPSDKAAVEYIQHMSHKTLVVFDGLEAFRHHSSKAETFDCRDEVDMSRLIRSIISGHTLKLVTLLVTSRLCPESVDQCKHFDRVLEIDGFTDSKVNEYMHKYGHEEAHIRNFLSDNINISSLCQLPMFCILICRIGKIGLEHDEQEPFPKTLTRLVVKCVDTFVRDQHPDFTGGDDVIAKMKDQLIDVSKLAKAGMNRQPVKVSFSKKDVKEFSQETATRCGFLNVTKKQATVSTRETEIHFVHLVIQEFFAAVALVSSLEDVEKLLTQTPNEGQLDMVLTFLSGLVGDSENRKFLTSLGYNTIITSGELFELVVAHCVSNEHKRKQLSRKTSIILLLRMVYESRDPSSWSKISDYVLNDRKELDISNIRITSVDLQALRFVVEENSDIGSVDLRDCDMTGDCGPHLERLSELTNVRSELQEVFRDVQSTCPQ